MAITKITIDGTEYQLIAIPNTPKRDWEILKGSFRPDITHEWEERCHKVGCDIWSVRRVSDNTIWTVGDDCFHGPIVRFNLRDNQITADFEYGDVGCSKLLSELSKPLQRTPLFETEDGVDIFEGDKWWSVWVGDGSYDISDGDTIRKYDPNFKGKRFSTEEKAKEYVILNKPCLSVNDVLSICDTTFEFAKLHTLRLKELAKQKLNKQ